ncbi:MAG TPA: hypothetical protein VF881_04455 [Polyangiaceae bacterium]
MFARLVIACFFLVACSSETMGRGSEPSGGSGGMVSGTTTGNGGATSSSTSTTSGSGGATSTSTGTTSSGAAGSGGAAPDGGDVGRSGSSGQAGSAEAGARDGGFLPITECTKPSVDRLESWQASGEGRTIPATGNLLIKEGDHYVAKVEFVNSEWHVIPVYLGNVFGGQADLSSSSGFLLTYSSTSDMYVQVRPASHWDGGNQYATRIPSTGGMKKSQFFSFAKENWKSIFDPPSYPYETALKEASAFVFVGAMPNTIVFSGLRIDGYIPPCR